MAKEIVDLPIQNGGSFHRFLYLYQRVLGGRSLFIYPMPARPINNQSTTSIMDGKPTGCANHVWIFTIYSWAIIILGMAVPSILPSIYNIIILGMAYNMLIIYSWVHHT